MKDRQSKSCGFWNGGAGAYCEALKQQHEAELAELNSQLAACERDAEQAKISRQIKERQAELKREKKRTRRLMF